jgi:uncharacterized membrane protein YdfJ with MMPL/SSD domain
VLTELMIGVLAALLVLAWVFGSILAFIPLLAALVSVLTMQLAIYGLTFVFSSASQPFNPAVQYIVALLGLGLSIDYALLIVTRWREERARGLSNDEAVKQAGGRLDWPRRGRGGQASRFWSWWARTVIRHRIAATVVGLGVLLGLCGAALSLNIGQPSASSLASFGPYAQSLQTMQADGFPSGVLTVIPVWLPSGVNQQATAASLAHLPRLERHGRLAGHGPAGAQDRHGTGGHLADGRMAHRSTQRDGRRRRGSVGGRDQT